MSDHIASHQFAAKQVIAGISQVQRRLQQRLLWRRWCALGCCGLALVGLGWACSPWITPLMIRITGSLLVVLAAWMLVQSRRAYQNLDDIAQSIERAQPELEQRLLTAVTRIQRQPIAPLGYLDATLLEQVRDHGRQNPWTALVPLRELWRLRVAAMFLAVVVIATLAALELRSTRGPAPVALNAPIAMAASPEITVEPGDTELELGTSLLATARFGTDVPRDATLVVHWEKNKTQRFPMSRRLDDPLFAAHVPQVGAPLTYQVEYGDAITREFKVNVFEYPALLQADAELRYPEYTQLPPKQVPNTRRITAVEGSEIQWLAQLNKSVARAWLEAEDGTTLELTADSNRPAAYGVALTLKTDQRWQLHLEDPQGRRNKLPVELSARALLNRVPVLKLTVATDLNVSPLEEVPIAATCWDDFGLTRYGVSYALAAQRPEERLLGEQLAGQQQADANYQFDLEALAAEPDQLLAYHFWAEDIGPDGQPRLTRSEMYFAEVRHFEEIFREGQSPPAGEAPPSQQGSNQNTQRAEELLKLQKQIVTATWNLLRRERPTSISTAYATDVNVLADSQAEALTKLEELAADLDDDQSRLHWQEAQSAMQSSEAQLRSAGSPPNLEPLTPALAAGQLAYQGLLRLRAREHEVIRGQQSQSAASSGGSAGGQQRSAQLQELELQNDRSRYETQRSAAAEATESASERETRQILNRLQELARRQEDVNRQLQELQTALQRAATPEQREELERQLKRLRDQQEQLLQDTDETVERVAQAAGQPQLQETRRQLEQSRDQLQQSSDATQQGDVSDALAAGTRAERQFRSMAEQLREQTADQFRERMESMRRQVQELDDREQELAQQLQQSESQPTPGLRPAAANEQLVDQLRKQTQDLQQLFENMQQTVQEAETPERLLAQKLYDALRQANQQQVAQRLEQSAQLLESGLKDGAQQLEAEANAGLRQLRQGVDEAAEGVLGNELEGLRRAAGELAELSDALNRELSANDPASSGSASPDDAGQSQASTSDGQASEGQASEGQASEGQASEGQASEGQASEGQASEGQASEGSARGSQASNGSSPADADSEGDASRRRAGARRGEPSSRGAGGASGPGDEEGRGGRLQSIGEQMSGGPITGDSFAPWSDRLRDVEEMIGDDELRARAAQIRDRARSVRREMQRHSSEPQWPLIRELIAQPLDELRDRVEQELARRSGQQGELVPIDQDPVPAQFSEQVRKYYEQLGVGK